MCCCVCGHLQNKERSVENWNSKWKRKKNHSMPNDWNVGSGSSYRKATAKWKNSNTKSSTDCRFPVCICRRMTVAVAPNLKCNCSVDDISGNPMKRRETWSRSSNISIFPYIFHSLTPLVKVSSYLFEATAVCTFSRSFHFHKLLLRLIRRDSKLATTVLIWFCFVSLLSLTFHSRVVFLLSTTASFTCSRFL